MQKADNKKATFGVLKRFFGVDWRPDVLLSYIFSAGSALVALWLIEQRTEFKPLAALKDLGLVPLATLLFSLGTLVYSIYRRFLGDFFFYPTQHLLHWILTFGSDHSVIGFFGKRGVPLLKTRAAYEELRHHLRGSGRGIEEIQRGELHILYIAATFAILYGLVAWIVSSPAPLTPVLAIAAILTFIAMLADSKQHSKELRDFDSVGDEEIKAFLHMRKLI